MGIYKALRRGSSGTNLWRVKRAAYFVPHFEQLSRSLLWFLFTLRTFRGNRPCLTKEWQGRGRCLSLSPSHCLVLGNLIHNMLFLVWLKAHQIRSVEIHGAMTSQWQVNGAAPVEWQKLTWKFTIIGIFCKSVALLSMYELFWVDGLPVKPYYQYGNQDYLSFYGLRSLISLLGALLLPYYWMHFSSFTAVASFSTAVACLLAWYVAPVHCEEGDTLPLLSGPCSSDSVSVNRRMLHCTARKLFKETNQPCRKVSQFVPAGVERAHLHWVKQSDDYANSLGRRVRRLLMWFPFRSLMSMWKRSPAFADFPTAAAWIRCRSKCVFPCAGLQTALCSGAQPPIRARLHRLDPEVTTMALWH